MKKKLRLHRTTIANLTAPALRGVAGGDSTDGAGVQSALVDTREVSCHVGTSQCASLGFACGETTPP
jgi:hypothetical protein